MGKYLGATGLGILWNKIKATFAKKTDVPTASTTTPNMDGTAAVGVATTYARADHRHPHDDSKISYNTPILVNNNFAKNNKFYSNKTENALYAADKRWIVTHKLFDSEGNFIKNLRTDLFNGNYDQGYNKDVLEGTYAELYIGVTDEESIESATTWFMTYCSGELIASFYYKSIPSYMTAKVYWVRTDPGWHDCSPEPYDDITGTISGAVYKIPVSGNYFGAIKITYGGITQSDGFGAGLGQVEWKQVRVPVNLQSAVTKYPVPQDLYGEVTAPKFIKRGGTSSQFLKADGSVDSNNYATTENIPSKVSDLINDGILLPNFDGLTPIRTIEFDKSASSWSQLFTRKNTGISTTMSEVVDVVLFRITVTGTNIYSRSDVIVKFQPGLTNPIAYVFHQTYSTTAETTGIRYIRFNYPKVLNNNIPWLVDFDQYNATARHFKVEVFADTENITWVNGLVATTYNSTDYSTANINLYSYRGLRALGTQMIQADSATAASYINSYLPKFVTGTPIKAGEALASYNIVFINNGLAYKFSDKTTPIDTDYGLAVVGTTYAANASIGYAYFRGIWSFRVTYANDIASVTRDTFEIGDKVYLRCTLQNGQIYSDAHLAKEMTAGYTWYYLGSMYTTNNDLAFNTIASQFITLDSNGVITHINGRPIQEEGVVFAGDDDGQGVIAEGGDVNVIETVKVNGTALTPDANKAVNVVVPTSLSGLASDTTHRTVTDTEKSTWNGKQDALVSGTNIKTINNQSLLGSGNITIQGGSGGSGDENIIESITFNGTAVPVDSNKNAAITVTIPAAVTESTVSGWGFTKNNGTYSKPSGGIPKTDLASAVQTSLGKADTALQSYTETDPTVPAWAKAATKPTYTAAEVGALPDTTTIPAAPGTLNTTATTAQSTSSSEALSGNITLHKVAKTGTYNDLIGKPTIPAAVTESTVTGWGFTKNTGTYSKPSTGIPASDLAAGVIPTVPTNVSAFTNDAGYLTSASVVTIYSGSTAPSSSLGNNGDIYIQTS